MVLYVEQTGYPKEVEADLGKIVDGDSDRLKTTPVPGSDQIIYNPSDLSGFGQNLINSLVNLLTTKLLSHGQKYTFCSHDL